MWAVLGEGEQAGWIDRPSKGAAGEMRFSRAAGGETGRGAASGWGSFREKPGGTLDKMELATGGAQQSRVGLGGAVAWTGWRGWGLVG